MARKKKQALQIAKTTEGWLDKKKGILVPFHDLTNEELQKAVLNTERQELYFFNKSAAFGRLVENLMNEAEKRGIELRHHKSQYTHNTHLKKLS